MGARLIQAARSRGPKVEPVGEESQQAAVARRGLGQPGGRQRPERLDVQGLGGGGTGVATVDGLGIGRVGAGCLHTVAGPQLGVERAVQDHTAG